MLYIPFHQKMPSLLGYISLIDFFVKMLSDLLLEKYMLIIVHCQDAIYRQHTHKHYNYFTEEMILRE